jgi:hypothetical protein
MLTNTIKRLQASISMFASADALSWDMIDTLSEWQNTSGAGEAKKLKKQKWPAHFRRTSGPLYRVMAMSAKEVQDIGKKGHIDIKAPASWTKSMGVIHEFATELFFREQMMNKGDNGCAVLITHKPQPSQVILDVDAIWKDPSYKAWVEHYEDQGKWFSEGRDFEGSQKEVILENVIAQASEVSVCPPWFTKLAFVPLEQYLKEVDVREGGTK